MQIEIDQSGKVEQLNTHTIIAGANKESVVIRITVSVKRKLIRQLRKTLVPHKDLIPIVFSVLVFLSLKQLKQLPGVIVIDEEYTGKENIIKETLKKLIAEHAKNRWQGYIRFKRIGKSSPAHKLAWKIHSLKKSARVKNIKETDILKLWE